MCSSSCCCSNSSRCCCCLLLQFVLLFSCIEGVHLSYDGYQFPAWSEGIGWLIAALVISMIPLWAGVAFYRSIGSCQALSWLVRSPASVIALNLRDIVSPSDDWGPALESNRHGPHLSPSSYRWVLVIVQRMRLRPLSRWFTSQLSSDSGSVTAVGDHEARCFVTETSFYQPPTADVLHDRY